MDPQNDNITVHTGLNNLIHTLLYEGYSLYPYRNSALKNKMPIPFGVVYPESYCRQNEHVHCIMQTECIVSGNKDLSINIHIRFLQINNDSNPENAWRAIERNVSPGNLLIENLLQNELIFSFSFDTEKPTEAEAATFCGISGKLVIKASQFEGKSHGFKISVAVINDTSIQQFYSGPGNEMMKYAFVSTHTILETEGGEFISSQDPPEEWREEMDQCKNLNTWPYLINKENTIMLSSSIILYDYPEIHPESIGDLFDGTEMEEALLLHVDVLSEDEKRDLLNGDDKLRMMMEKVEKITPEEIINLHDKMKNSKNIF